MDKQHASMVHMSVNFKLSCIVFMIILSDKCSKANNIYMLYNLVHRNICILIYAKLGRMGLQYYQMKRW